jgi:hypothetical protein
MASNEGRGYRLQVVWLVVVCMVPWIIYFFEVLGLFDPLWSFFLRMTAMFVGFAAIAVIVGSVPLKKWHGIFVGWGSCFVLMVNTLWVLQYSSAITR